MRTPSFLQGICERVEHGTVVLYPSERPSTRRVLFVNNYGGTDVWKRVKDGALPPHHLWGCLELVQQGYEVALANPVNDFNPRRRPLPHDLRLFKLISTWLRRDDIVYCGHNVLFWIPFLKNLGLIRRHIVSLLFAREPLAFASAHSAVIALTPVAEAQARLLAPNAKIAHLGWGVNPELHPAIPYSPKYLLHCGIAGRDFATLKAATRISSRPVRIVTAWDIEAPSWPPHVDIVDGGSGYNHERKKVSFQELFHTHYANSAATLITTESNPAKDHAFGFTNLIEALALSQPVIHTRTGALADEIDVEQEGCGLSVPPGDPASLAHAMDYIMSHPDRAKQMGEAGRRLCDRRYNMARFSRELHSLFEQL